VTLRADPRAATTADNPDPFFTRPSQDGHKKAGSSAARKGARRALHAKRTDFVPCPQIPSKRAVSAVLAGYRTRSLRGFRERRPGNIAALVQTLVTGVSGYVGAALVPRLRRDGHVVRGFARSPQRVAAAGVELEDVVIGDATTGAGLERALDGVEVAYYLIHSMEGPATTGAFADTERRQATRFAAAARKAGVRRIVYLGGLVPRDGTMSRHLASRLAVEQALLAAAPESVALRASIVIGARSRSFRFLVRLVERLPVLALPAWREHRTQPIDGRDVLEFLAAAATLDRAHAGRSWDVAGPDAMTYEQLVDGIADAMMVGRPKVGLGFDLTPVASVFAAAVAGEEVGLIGPLMESLEHDLLPRHDGAAAAFGVRLHRFRAAVERALREIEESEEVAAR
jgi:uncharacterized protein YbjT (DUF2867 family)